MPEAASKPISTMLEPMERIAEILFGVIMTLTFTCTLAVETADRLQVCTMLIGALGCNLAWGIIDAGVYLITRINTESRKVAAVRAIREAADGRAARQILANSFNPALASALSNEQLESMRQNLRQMPEPLQRPKLTKRDWLGAGGLCLLCFVSIRVRCQVSFAHFQCRRGSTTGPVRLCVRLPQRDSALGDGASDGGIRRCDGRRRNCARRVATAHAWPGCRTLAPRLLQFRSASTLIANWRQRVLSGRKPQSKKSRRRSILRACSSHRTQNKPLNSGTLL